MSNHNSYLQDVSLPKSKYEEDIFINNHTTVWGSWWKDHQWGYKCCKQTIKNSYCTGLAGIEAAEASADLMKANMARKEAAEGTLSRKCFNLFIILDNLHWM
jgi:pre-mRNA-processing factor SLU7